MAAMCRRNDAIAIVVFSVLGLILVLVLSTREYNVFDAVNECTNSHAISWFSIEDNIIGDQLLAKVLRNTVTGITV